MIKETRRVFNVACFLSDGVSLVAGFFLAHLLRDQILPQVFPYLADRPFFSLRTYIPVLFLSFLVVVGAMFSLEGYRRQPIPSLGSIFVQNLQVVLLAFVLALALAYALRLTWLSRLFLALVMLFFLVLGSLTRYGLAHWFRRRAQRGSRRRVVVLVGANPGAREVARRILAHPEMGIQLRGFYEYEASYDPSDVEMLQHMGIPYLGDVGLLPDFLKREVVDGVIFSVGTRIISKLEEIFLLCEDLGVDTLMAANLFPHLVARLQLEHLEDLPLLRFTTVPHNHIALFLKRMIDFSGSGVGLVLLSPLFLATAMAIKINSRGPVFFRQERMSVHGRRFQLMKFRTMVQNAEEMRDQLEELNEVDGPVFKIKDDPRITSVGRILRKTSIDELPQLWNVLKGEMSLVGPRPPIPAEVDEYEPWQRRRLSMRPGITCLWQISGRSELDFNTWMKLDLQYIDQWSLALDFLILIKTIPAVLSMRGAA